MLGTRTDYIPIVNPFLQPARGSSRLKILVIGGGDEFFSRVNFMLSPDFILKYKARIQLCQRICDAILKLESEEYDAILMEDVIDYQSGAVLREFLKSADSLSSKAEVITISCATIF